MWYWCFKYFTPTFHAQPHGGRRRALFTVEEQYVIEAILWTWCKQQPTTRLREYARKFRTELGLPLKVGWLGSIFRKWHWTWKKVDARKLEKYT